MKANLETKRLGLTWNHIVRESKLADGAGRWQSQPMGTDTIKIDKAGRVMLPKQVRDQLGLEAGDSLHLEVRPDAIELRPDKPEPHLDEADGLLVLKGVAWDEHAMRDLVTRDREERLAALVRRSAPSDR